MRPRNDRLTYRKARAGRPDILDSAPARMSEKVLEWAKRILVSHGIPGVTDDGPCELSCPDVEICELAEWTECERRIARARQLSPNAESIPFLQPPDQKA